MSSIGRKPSSRYPSLDSRSSTSSQISDPSSSVEFRNPSAMKKKTNFLGGGSSTTANSSRAIVRTKSSDLSSGAKINKNNDQNLSSMLKHFMDKRSNKSKAGGGTPPLFIPADVIAEDLKKNNKGSNFTSLHRKLFQKGSSSTKPKALTEVTSNTRTLAMVLRSERELLNQNKDYESQISELKLCIQEKNMEVEKLKDLCLKQREEIKALKSAVLFPDVTTNPQLQSLLEEQGSELQHAKQVIPTLQRQVTSLTGQLRSLADDLAEVKADKYAARICFEDHVNSPGTPVFDEEATNSLEFSSGDQTGPGSPDDVFLRDFNPCLTPYSTKSKSKDFVDAMGYASPEGAGLFGSSRDIWSRKTSKSSEYCQRPDLGTSAVPAFSWSTKNKCSYGKATQHKLF